jgi:MFS-type transporter involved in bile tolerance (Atg22 family)
MEERPVNTLNLHAALACTAVLSLAFGVGGLGAFGLGLAGAAGFGVLGALTFGFLQRRLGFGGPHFYAGSVLVPFVRPPELAGDAVG